MKERILFIFFFLCLAGVDYAQTVTIGSQIWMSKNLNVDKFRNGDLIPHAKTKDEWERAGKQHNPAWCYYNNDPANGKTYGKLYNYYAIIDYRGLAPEGFHISTREDWTILTEFLGGELDADKKIKSKSGWQGNANGTNSSGFSALPGGCRSWDGVFNDIGAYASWWMVSAEEMQMPPSDIGSVDTSTQHIYIYFGNEGSNHTLWGSPDIFVMLELSNEVGLNVRCLKN